ncbi:LptF/LptG family permease [Verrucomicrobiaceae bacterium R5-34]|uniref:LptF/LptG family permease n=1 Tax=Oceaniferula flava TaxID=2800421 RepID=A0AAE2S8T5_9BACT|nr:LptF/LptG family permease [Oceaniferula flavus]MBK1829336.1 LptF/LptG family permease [Verrucomicrobiaceae bacterium R5-34]MBK1853563.1 LptF/LptG family permease [Oceaniferula flavus]MBM1134868.1 LptF/LptG family permease [Oceaniferula flavus]
MAGTSSIRTFLWPVLLTVLGGVLCTYIVPREMVAVNEHILGFPDTDIPGHQLRPYLLAVLCLLPASAAWLYRFSGTLDRYMARQFLSSFALCMGALLAVMLLTDFQNNLSDFQETENPMAVITSYYSIHIPAIFVFLLPYVLLLALLYCLGKMSRHQEIVAMIQTGRGVFRIVVPLLVTGVFCSLVCLIFNYHWGPWAEGHKDMIIDVAKDGQADRARSVLYRDDNSRRVWLVGAFPYQFEKTGELRNVTVRQFNSGGHPTKKLEADVATWSRIHKNWTFSGVQLIDLQASPVPIRVKTDDTIVRTWQETPWQIVKPGLDQSHLGIPELNSWLKANEGVEWVNRRPYLTQWHYRFAQPVICLITILIAAPLGIVFSRRGIGGGVSIALFLCAGMLFSSSFFLTFGEAGHLPPALAAWSTNILFALIALYLFNRRLTGRPIYQSLKKLLPAGE